MNQIVLRPETVKRIQARMALANVAEDQIEEAFVRGSGAGGQKINKTSSCVQLRHVPSGAIVRCQKTRSREANRWLAREMLAERLLEKEASALSARRQETERIRRQKRRRSKRQKARMLAEKRLHSEKKEARRAVSDD